MNNLHSRKGNCICELVNENARSNYKRFEGFLTNPLLRLKQFWILSNFKLFLIFKPI